MLQKKNWKNWKLEDLVSNYPLKSRFTMKYDISKVSALKVRGSKIGQKASKICSKRPQITC